MFVSALFNIMRFSLLLALVCVFIVTVYGAREATTDGELLASAEREERVASQLLARWDFEQVADAYSRAAEAYVTLKHHGPAARSYYRAYSYYKLEAQDLVSMKEFQRAARFYLKAAAMCAAEVQEKKRHMANDMAVLKLIGGLGDLTLVDLMIDVESHEKKGVMHENAADCYLAAAEKCEAENEGDEMHLMAQAAAKQCRAAARQYEAVVMMLVYLKRENDAYRLCVEAARLYEEGGQLAKADSMIAASKRLVLAN